MTQQKLGEALGYDGNYVAKIEGGTRPPSRAFLARLSLVAGQTEEALLRASVGDVARPPLPQPPDSLIGRDDALDVIGRLLAGPARCVTLVGAPGIGKTRLAMEVAQRLDRVFPQGSWWVPLLDARSPDDVGQQLRRTLGVPDQAGADPVEASLERIRDDEVLLVFDNFEHVIEARSVVSRLVAAGPGVRALVTSREALELLSEHVVSVTALPFPDPAGTLSFDAIRTSLAVELFVARATMARPEFRLTPSNCGAVLATCALRDGIPLGIVLAAGGMRTTDAAGLATRLEGQLDLPGGAPADMPPQHETLETAISSSWTLLDDEEQALFASLAAFSGGFTAAAAAAVDGRSIEQAEALLADLARKSLVEARPDADSGPRFEQLETIRSFARTRLERSGRLDEVGRRHVRYFVDFAEDCGRRVVGPEQVRCAHAFRENFDNLRVAFDSSLKTDPTSAIRLAASLWRCFLMGDITTGRRWLNDALALAPDASPARATALAAAGALGWITGHTDLAARCLDEAGKLAAELGLDDVAALVLVNEGALAEQQGRLNDADDRFTTALRLSERMKDIRGQAVALNGLGMIHRRRGDIRQAWPLWTQAAALFRAVGDGMNESIALDNIAWAAEVEGRLDEAEAISLDCRRIQIVRGDARGLATTTAALGRLAFLRRDYEEASTLQQDALIGFHRLGDVPWVASSLLALAAIEASAERYERAVALLSAVEGLRDEIGIRPREDEQVLLDGVVARCEAALDDDHIARAVVAGRAMTLSEAVALAANPPAPVT
jgi:predicted ATPase